MKDYNEMASSVFRRRDEYFAAQKKKTAMLIKVGLPSAALLLAVLAGLGFILRGDMPEIPAVVPTTPTVSSTEDITDHTFVTDNRETVVGTEGILPTDATENALLPQDPTEPSTKGDSGNDTPVQEPTSGDYPQTETKGDEPEGDSIDLTEPPAAYPEAPPTEGDEPGYPIVPDDTVAAGVETSPVATECTPTPEEPTEPNTGPLTIYAGGEVYTAQVGDTVSVTVELYAKKLVDEIELTVHFGNDKLRVVDLTSYGYTFRGAKEEWLPNISFNKVTLYNHTYSPFWINATDLEQGFDFTEKKVLLTFDTIVKEGGEVYINPAMLTLGIYDSDKYYFENSLQKITSGVEVDLSLKVTSKSRSQWYVPVVDYTPAEENGDFTYPAESTDGDLAVKCGSRTYSADIGDTIVYTVELKAEKRFENIQAVVYYDPSKLQIVDRTTATDNWERFLEAGEFSAPNFNGSTVNYYYAKHQIQGDPYRVMLLGSSVSPKYDFRERKVVLALEFLVIDKGQVEIAFEVQEMSIDYPESYFTENKQEISEGISIYPYVIVE